MARPDDTTQPQPPVPALFTTLDQLPKQAVARIVEVGGEDGVTLRLLEMGLTEGERIVLIGRAPFGDPLEFLIRGYRLSLRSTEARRIRVELEPGTGHGQ